MASAAATAPERAPGTFTFSVNADHVGLICDACQEEVCAVDDNDDLQVIVQMAGDHIDECVARSRKDANA